MPAARPWLLPALTGLLALAGLTVQPAAAQGSAAPPARTAPPTSAPAAPAPALRPPTDAADLLGSPRFRRGWSAGIGQTLRTREPWLARMNGPAAPARWVEVGGRTYALHAFCKPHDCGDNSAVALLQPATGQVIGLVQRGRQQTLVGVAPGTPAAAELQRLWHTEWRASSR